MGIVLFENKSDCCACGACLNVCSKSAISMKPDAEGFLYPEIDPNKCVECGVYIFFCYAEPLHLFRHESVTDCPIRLPMCESVISCLVSIHLAHPAPSFTAGKSV